MVTFLEKKRLETYLLYRSLALILLARNSFTSEVFHNSPRA